MSATNVARAGKRGNICVGNNVSSFARALSLTGEIKLHFQISPAFKCGQGLNHAAPFVSYISGR